MNKIKIKAELQKLANKLANPPKKDLGNFVYMINEHICAIIDEIDRKEMMKEIRRQ